MSGTEKWQFSLVRFLIAVIAAGVLLGLTQRIPADYRPPESVMRERIRNTGFVPEPHCYRVGVPFGGLVMKEIWDAKNLTRSEEIVEVRYLEYAGNALFWFLAMVAALTVAFRIARRSRET